MRRVIQLLYALLFVFSASSAKAIVAVPVVNVSLLPFAQDAVNGDILALQIFGEYVGASHLLSGGVNLGFDPAALSITSVTVPAGLGDISISNGTIDNLSGNVTEIGFASFSGVTGSFLFATVNLRVLGGGSTQLTLSDANSAVFVWSNDVGPFGEVVLPQFSNATINVAAVPLPLPVVLLGSALLGVFGAARRQM